MEENFHHLETILVEVFLPVVNLFIPLFPEVLMNQVLRELAFVNQVVNAGDNDVLILGAVENADVPRSGRALLMRHM